MTSGVLPVPGEVHLWALSLDPPELEMASMAGDLDAAERARADTFSSSLHRRRYVAGRAQLRRILCGYMDTAPLDLKFIYNAYGRPSLAGGTPGFNLSHADGIALCAVANGQAIGVDIEPVRPMANLPAVARQIMSPLEWLLFNDIPESERLLAFYRCWTRKEAYLKARGIGIGAELQKISMSLRDETSPRFLQCAVEGESTHGWHIRAWGCGEDLVGALAAKHAGAGVSVVWKQRWPAGIAVGAGS